MGFEFATSARIVFGRGVFAQAGRLSAELGRRALIVSGSSERHSGPLERQLADSGVAARVVHLSGEPTTDAARDGVRVALEHQADLVIAVGGGSALDLGKAIAALLGNGGDPLDYLEVIGQGKKIERPALPFIAVPTTSGTGSEVTKNAVLESPEHRVKVSLRSPWLLPKLALLDPDLTLSVPKAVTASTGFDALAQVIEPYVSSQANPLTDAICREGMKRGARSLLRAFEQGSDVEAREDMALCSLCGGLALANAKLGAVHGFAGPLGGMYRAAHGALCATLLPHVMRINVAALGEREPDSPVLGRYDEVARWVTGRDGARAADAVLWASDTARRLGIPGLSAMGVKRADFGDIVAKAARASSMQGNPIVLSERELTAILEQAL